jgi:hypothetical protein
VWLSASLFVVYRCLTIIVHVSPCGRHLALLLQSCRLIIVEDFERAIKQDNGTPINIEDISIDVQVGPVHSRAKYLAYGENGRIGVASVSPFLI